MRPDFTVVLRLFTDILHLFYNQFTCILQLFYCLLIDLQLCFNYFTVILKLFYNYFYSYLDRTGRAGQGERVGGRVRRVAGRGPGQAGRWSRVARPAAPSPLSL